MVYSKFFITVMTLLTISMTSQSKTLSSENVACLPKAGLKSEMKDVSKFIEKNEKMIPGYNSCNGKQKGIASVYGLRGRDSFAGKRTASGETMRPEKLRAATLQSASQQYPMGSWVRVRNGDRSVVVCINDKGGGKRGRVIDLSAAASKKLGGDDLTKVEVECLLKPADGPGRCDDKVAAHITANDY